MDLGIVGVVELPLVRITSYQLLRVSERKRIVPD